MTSVHECPAMEDLWPVIVGEAAGSDTQEHIERCPRCRHRLKRWAKEIAQQRYLASLGSLPPGLPDVKKHDDSSGELPVVSNLGVPETIENYVIDDELAQGG